MKNGGKPSKEIDDNLLIANSEADIVASYEEELNDVYKPYQFKEVKPSGDTENIRLIDAISSSLRQSMQKHENLVIIVGTLPSMAVRLRLPMALLPTFGKERVINTPICESAVVSAGWVSRLTVIKPLLKCSSPISYPQVSIQS
jgi:2-oxoisovalerate dehydrogenase E1 component